MKSGMVAQRIGDEIVISAIYNTEKMKEDEYFHSVVKSEKETILVRGVK